SSPAAASLLRAARTSPARRRSASSAESRTATSRNSPAMTTASTTATTVRTAPELIFASRQVAAEPVEQGGIGVGRRRPDEARLGVVEEGVPGARFHLDLVGQVGRRQGRDGGILGGVDAGVGLAVEGQHRRLGPGEVVVLGQRAVERAGG